MNIIQKYVGTQRHPIKPGSAPRAPGSYLVRRGSGYRFTDPLRGDRRSTRIQTKVRTSDID